MLSSAVPAEIVKKVNELLSKIEDREELSLHSILSKNALQFIYRNRSEILFTGEGVREHVLWRYFSDQIAENPVSEDFLESLLQEYKATKYIGLESVVVSALKSDLLTEMQVLKVSGRISTHVVQKECYAFQIRKKIQLGQSLTEKEIAILLDNRLYSTIELAFDKQSISSDGLMLLMKPYDGEQDKKLRRKLSLLAQRLIKDN
ncbi:hypothetical protein ACE6ED_24845 [Paenibacillus sp. CN-4]|uniref:hypothetical protein n=1 Tax=Paenibacillus nanchangensis TaxID=3348343 RepID=UPI00397A3BAB